MTNFANDLGLHGSTSLLYFLLLRLTSKPVEGKKMPTNTLLIVKIYFQTC